MYITPINSLGNYNRYTQNSAVKQNRGNSTPVFTGINLNNSTEKSFRSLEYIIRIAGNKFADLFESKQRKLLTKSISEITPEANKKYLTQLDIISRLYSTNKCIDINIEDNILERIAQKGNSTIFIMNHSNQSQDPSMMAVLNTLLTAAYQKADKREFPLPKIILNQDILTTMNSTKRKAFEAFGAVGIDASIHGADTALNAKAFLPLIKDFVKDKCNIFIFPEGRLAVHKNLPFEERFQSGIAELINKVLGIKKEVTVVPVGFAYGKGTNKELNGIHIGEPIIFKRTKERETTTTEGLLTKSQFADEDFKKFFLKHKDQKDIAITESGIPVKPNEITGYIKSILAENLAICTKEAEKKIESPLNPDDVALM